MSRSLRVYELLAIVGIIILAFIAGSFTASFVAASQVERHIDDTIARTVLQQVNLARNQSVQQQRLFAQVNSICESLSKTPSSGIHC